MAVLFLWLPLFNIYTHGFFTLPLGNMNELKALLSNRSLGLLQNTLFIAGGTALACLFVSLPLGYFFGQAPFQDRGYWKYSCLIPILIPPHVNVMVWIDLLRNNGFLNQSLMTIFHLHKPLFNVLSLGGVIFVLTLSYYPYLLLFVLSGILSLDPSFEEAGRLSMDPRKVFMRITLPFLKGYILAGLIIVFVFSAANYGVPALLGVHTYPVEIFSEFSAFFNTERAILSSLPLLFLVTGFMAWHWWLMRRCNFAVLSPRFFLKNAQEIKYRCLALCLWGVVIVLSVVIPICWLFWISASPRNYVMVLKTAWRPILTTITLAAATATVAAIFSYIAGYLIVRVKSLKTQLLDLFSFFPLAIPGTILGVGMIKVWNHPLTDFIYGSLLVLILAYLVKFFSFSLRCVIPSISQISPSLEESFLIYNKGWFRRQRQIVSPLARQGILLA
jgi:iron(III) transport system permease protein